MKKLILLVGMIALLASSAFAATGIVGKNGETATITDPVGVSGTSMRDDFEYNTGGSIDFIPDLGGSDDGWGTHFMAMTTNNTGQDLYLTELSFPCGGTIPAGWFVSIGAMPGDYNTDFMGEFMATDPGEPFPPTVYTYVDVSMEGMVVPTGMDVYWGYINPGIGGQTYANGVTTWAWYLGAWDPDSDWGRTAILQIKASFEDPVGTQSETMDAVKALYR
jgi:hypothetical protein